MLKTLFHLPASEAVESNVLLGEVGVDYCCLALGDSRAKSIHSLHYLSMDSSTTTRDVANFFGEKAQGTSLEKVVLCSAYSEALIVPQKIFTKENPESLLSSVYNTAGQTVKHDVVHEWQVAILYAVPTDILQSIENTFQHIDVLHTYTASLKVNSGITAENDLSLHFTPKHFKVILKKGQQLKLAQTYSYTTPLDVVYYLLKIYEVCHLSQEETHVMISGLVEKDSALYRELQNYFLNIIVARPLIEGLPKNEHPHHFFTSMYTLAACVL